MKLLCIGDVAITNKLNSLWCPPTGIYPGDEVRVLFNWELPIGITINSVPRISGPRLLSHPESIGIIRKWAPGFAALATNHILDGGEVGLAETINALLEAGFQTVGAGLSEDEIKTPLIWETGEGRLAIVNWVFPETHPDCNVVPGPHCWPGLEAARRMIQNQKSKADWVMVFAHWSDELFSYPRPEDRMIAHELAQMGADIIIGHHPHVIRGMETMGTCPVFYSIGNYFFSDCLDSNGGWIVRQAPRNCESLGLMVNFERGFQPKYQFLSLWKTSERTIQDPLQRAIRRMDKVSSLLRKYHDGSYIDWYSANRARFNHWEYQVHFRLWELGISGLTSYIRGKLFP